MTSGDKIGLGCVAVFAVVLAIVLAPDGATNVPRPKREARVPKAAPTQRPEPPKKSPAELGAEAAAEAEKKLADKWLYFKLTDDMTSKQAYNAQIESENFVDFDFPYQGEQHGKLLLRKHPSHGRDVIFRVDRGQMLCRSYQDCTIRVRFDEAPPKSWKAVGPTDGSSTVIFLRNEATFRQQLKKAKRVLLQVEFYSQGNQTFEFLVSGFQPDKLEGK